MTTVTTLDYPAAQLPAEVRKGIDPTARVRVEVTAIPSAGQRPRLRELMGRGAGVYPTPEAADAYIRALRDEWD